MIGAVLALVIGLAVALGFALIAVLVLALSRRRLERLVARERAEGGARALATRAALQERLALDVAVIVAPLRALLEEQARARAASAPTMPTRQTNDSEGAP